MKKLQQEVIGELSQLQNLPPVTMEELAKHNKPDDAWVLIDGVVYDVTKFAALHPGGKDLLLKYAGTDATKDFKMMHPETVLQKPAYAKMRVGRLAIEALPPAEAKKLIAAKVKERFVPWSEPYWLDPRGTLASPYYQPKHLAFQKKVRAFVEKSIKPFANQWDEEGKYPLDLHETAYKAGIYGAPWPAEYGGTPPEGGWDAFMDFIYLYEMGKCGSGGVMASWFFTASIALPPILHHGSQAMRERVCRDVITGKSIIGLAITEPWGGSDVANLRTTAVDMGDHYVVNGEKKFITSGLTAKYLTTAVRTDPSKKGAAGISLLLIETDLPGVTRKKIKTQGWWAGNTTYITFESVKVPKANLIGKLNEGFRYIMENFNHERFAACVMSGSAAHKCIEHSIKFARVRETFGKRLIDHQVIRHKLGDMAMRTEAHFAWCEQIAYQLDKNCPHVDIGPRIALCKVNGTRLMGFCAREASQILGGNSYARQGHGAPIERLYREVLVNSIGGGSAEIMIDQGMKMSNL